MWEENERKWSWSTFRHNSGIFLEGFWKPMKNKWLQSFFQTSWNLPEKNTAQIKYLFLVFSKAHIVLKGENRVVPKKRGTFILLGHAVAALSWGTVTNLEVADSIPDGVTGIFHWLNPSGRIRVLGLIQPLTEMSTRNIFWGVQATGA
jgi:hypothetical protein